MSALRSGRDVVFEVSGAKMRDLILRLARLSPDASCIPPDVIENAIDLDITHLGFNHVAVWPYDVALEQDPAEGAVAKVTAKTSLLPEHTQSQSLSAFADQFPTSLPFLRQVGATVDSVNLRVVDEGALAAGLALTSGDRPNDRQWSAFQADFLEGNDWGVAIAGSVVVQFINDILKQKVDEYNANPDREATFEFIRATSWGNPVQIHGRGAADSTCGSLDFEFRSTGRFRVDAAHRLWFDAHLEEKGLTPASLAAAIFCGIGLFIVAIPALGILIDEAVSGSQGGDDDQSYSLAEVVFDFPGPSGVPAGRLEATGLRQTSNDLRIFGTFAIEVPGTPQISLSADRLEFRERAAEYAEAYCSGDSSPRYVQTQRVEVGNVGDGLLWLCDIELLDSSDASFSFEDGATVPTANDGRRFVNTPIARSSENRFLSIPVRYAGPLGSGARGTLRILCNDPGDERATRFVTEIPLQTVPLELPTGRPGLRVVPSRIDIRVANRPDGRPRSRIVRCGIVEEGPEPDDRAVGIATITVVNPGTGPLYLCEPELDDPAGVFAAGGNPVTVLPGKSATIGIRFFPAAVMVDYDATLTIRSNAGTVPVTLHGRVETIPARQTDEFGIDGALLEHIADLVGEALCVPPNADICRVRGRFEAIRDPETIAVGLLTFAPTPRGGEVRLIDRHGEPWVRDFSGEPVRHIGIDYPPPDRVGWAGPNPCIAEFDGFTPGDLRLMQVRVGGRLIRPVGTNEDVDGVRSIAAARGLIYLGADDGVHVIDWRDAGRPVQVAHVRLDPVRALEPVSGALLVAAGDEVQVLDLSQPDKPARGAARRVRKPPTALSAIGRSLYAVDGSDLTTFEFDGTHLRQIDEQPVPGGAGGLFPWGDGLFVAGNRTLTSLAERSGGRPRLESAQKIAKAASRVSTFGNALLISDDDGTDAYAVDDKRALRQVAEYRRRHWSADFITIDDPRGLFTITAKGRAQRWESVVHRLDRTRYQDILRLEFLPRR